MKRSGKQVYRFEQYILEVAEHRLKRGEKEISLQPKAFETLVYLVERHGHLVKKDELLDGVWVGVVVSEGALTLRIKELRQALEDDAKRPRYIKTIPTVGYKFIGDVEEITETDETQESRVEDIREQPPIQNEVVASARPGRWTSFRSARIPFFALAGAAVLLGLALANYSFRPGAAVSPVRIKSIAVIPFKPLSAKDGDEALEMGMADSLIAKLNNVSQLIVRPLSAVRNYRTLEQDAVAAGREQGVDTVLDGSIQRSGERIRIRVRLVSVEDGKLLWTDEFDEKFTNVFSVQDLISEQVVRALAVKLTGEERALFTKQLTQNAEAYGLYSLGRHLWAQGTEEGLTKSIDYFRQAIRNDSNYAWAYAGLADSYIRLGSHGYISMTESSSKAREAAGQALDIDEQLGEAHVSMGSILAGSWEWVESEKHYKRALELIPNDHAAHERYSEFLADAGRIDEAIREAKLAQQIYPTSQQGSHAMAYALYFDRRYAEAIEQSRKTLELDPNSPVAHIISGMSYTQLGMHGKAAAELQQARPRSPTPDFLALEGYAYAMAGRKNEAQSVLEQLMELSKKRYVSSFPVAMIYTGLGEKKLAIESLEQAIRERAAHLAALKVDPTFDSLRLEPQFAQLLRQMGREQ